MYEVAESFDNLSAKFGGTGTVTGRMLERLAAEARKGDFGAGQMVAALAIGLWELEGRVATLEGERGEGTSESAKQEG